MKDPFEGCTKHTRTIPVVPEHIRKCLHIICNYATDTAEEKLSAEDIMFAGADVMNYFLSGFPGEEIVTYSHPKFGCFTSTETNDFMIPHNE